MCDEFFEKYSVIGSDLIILKNDYDKNQLWFDFMKGVVLTKHFHRKYEIPYQKTSNKISDKKIKPIYTGMYNHIYKGQMCLPFYEFREIGIDENINMCFIGGDLNKDGSSIYVEFGKSRIDAKKWLETHCRYRYKTNSRQVWFERKSDAIMFKIFKSSQE